MAGQPLYKTKICVLYREGHCSRQACSFAHGDAELRRFSGSFNPGRREQRGNDLRDKLGRRSPPQQQRYPLGRDAKGRHAFHDQKQLPYDRGYSRSRSPSKRSEGKYPKKSHVEGRNDVSGSFKFPNGADGAKDRPCGANNILENKLKQVKLDIAALQEEKCQLEIYMNEKIQEADSLASRNEELETQLRKEQEHCKRVTSKIKKYVRAHSRYSKAQEELKRSQARLYKLGDQLASEVSRPNDNEEDSSVNIASDGEPMHDNDIRLATELRNNVSPIKKRPWISLGDNEETKLASKTNMVESTRLENRQIFANKPSTQSNDTYKEADAVNNYANGSNGRRSLPVVEKYKRRKNGPSSIAFSEKVKGLESGHFLPSTSMAAHAVDEFIDIIEMEDKVEEETGANVLSTEVQEDGTTFQYLPPPPPLPPQNCYKLYEAEDHEVDVEEIDGQAREADINSEVDIEQL